MSGNTYKMTTLVGESPESIEAAVLTALSTSAKNVHGQEWCQVTDIRANVNESGGVDRWQVELKVAFEVDGS
jgi:dodecin